jgi:hypothetical protein
MLATPRYTHTHFYQIPRTIIFPACGQRSDALTNDTMSSRRRYEDPYFRSLPFDQQLARTALSSINAGADGVESMQKCQCSMEVYEVKGYER